MTLQSIIKSIDDEIRADCEGAMEMRPGANYVIPANNDFEDEECFKAEADDPIETVMSTVPMLHGQEPTRNKRLICMVEG